METEGKLRMADVFVGILDPRQARKVKHELVELLVIAVCGVLAGTDDFDAAHNFAVTRHFALNLIRLDPVKRKGGLKVRRLIAATSDSYRAQRLGLV
jgi:hypothetical protein